MVCNFTLSLQNSQTNYLILAAKDIKALNTFSKNEDGR